MVLLHGAAGVADEVALVVGLLVVFWLMVKLGGSRTSSEVDEALRDDEPANL